MMDEQGKSEEVEEESIATVILNRLEKITVNFDELTIFMENKLSDICVAKEEEPKATGEIKQRRTYPPYFEGISDRLSRLERIHEHMADMIKRCAL